MDSTCVQVLWPTAFSAIADPSSNVDSAATGIVIGWCGVGSDGTVRAVVASVICSRCKATEKSVAQHKQECEQKPATAHCAATATAIGVWHSGGTGQGAPVAAAKAGPWIIFARSSGGQRLPTVVSACWNATTLPVRCCSVILYDYRCILRSPLQAGPTTAAAEPCWDWSLQRAACAHLLHEQLHSVWQQRVSSETCALCRRTHASAKRRQLTSLLSKLLAASAAKLPVPKAGDRIGRLLARGSQRWLLCAHLLERRKALAGLPKLVSAATATDSSLRAHAEAELAVSTLHKLLCHAVVDLSLGCALAAGVYCHQASLVSCLSRCSRFVQEAPLLRQITWLNHHPGGFKLNLPAATTLGQATIMIVQVYCAIIRMALAHVQWLVLALCLSSAFGGISTASAAVFDLFWVLTLHVTLIHRSLSVLYRGNLTAVISLWHLFRGKKRNVLRHRIDSCSFDHAQLMLGTLMFTVLLFLLPTVAVHYLFFSLLKMAQVAVQAALAASYVLVSNLPVCHIVSGSHGSDVYMVMLGIETSPALASNLDKTAAAPHVTTYMQLKQRRETLLPAGTIGAKPRHSDTND
ncbi:N-acetylglucosaminyl transferase component-domain-containing protein [Tribonema minus]|uniref:N-acetylglucosaminyl transferase component-domain-containing protein n=1 Tax=Tribonema minus TaxID=303371 RepID=A0A835ZDM7_9STRA|nr:N-acetylglucosaminyl transferase component-domain-containing protein [Tribonema minus]